MLESLSPIDVALIKKIGGNGSSYTLPIASPTVLGGVKPVAKTEDMTQSVGVDEAGALWAPPGSGGGGEQPVLFVKATLDDPEWDGKSETTISMDKTFDEIDSAFQSGKYVFVDCGDIGLPELMQLKRGRRSGEYYLGAIVGNRQLRLFTCMLAYFGDKWHFVVEEPTVYDMTVSGLYIYGEDSRMYKISVNNGTLTVTRK